MKQHLELNFTPGQKVMVFSQGKMVEGIYKKKDNYCHHVKIQQRSRRGKTTIYVLDRDFQIREDVFLALNGLIRLSDVDDAIKAQKQRVRKPKVANHVPVSDIAVFANPRNIEQQ